MKSTLLEPTYIFDNEYQLNQTINLTSNYEQIPNDITENNQDFQDFSGRIGHYWYKKKLDDNLEPWEIIRLIKQTRIEIAEYAESTIIGSDHKYDKIKAELGMNIIIPKGKIEQLRFEVSFKENSSDEPIIAVDGLPSDLFDEKYLKYN